MSKYCIYCGKEINGDNNICFECKEKDIENKKVELQFCTQCGSKRAGKGVYCINCSHKFEDLIDNKTTSEGGNL
jgi:DNA-directed RNA polymerase subunit RPC12/RpoP